MRALSTKFLDHKVGETFEGENNGGEAARLIGGWSLPIQLSIAYRYIIQLLMVVGPLSNSMQLLWHCINLVDSVG